jgi:hypothetical protein
MTLHLPTIRRSRKIFLALCLLCLSGSSAAFGQVSGCPQPSGNASWPRNSTVYVTVDSSIGEPERTQISEALTGWNGANAVDNNSGVRFQVGPPAYDGAPTLLVTNGTVYSNGNGTGWNTGSGTVATDIGALTQRNGFDSAGQLSNATITFNTGGAQACPLSNSCGPLYNPNASGYDTFFLKILLHELGHTMGLGDAAGSAFDQTPQNSVMNGLVDNCPNDDCTVNGVAGGNLPTTVTPCDNGGVNGVWSYELLAGGGGGGGGDDAIMPYYSGGYDSYCTPYYWVWYESYDGGKTWYETGEVEYAGCW